MNAVVLGAIAGGPIARQLEPDEVGHHAAAGEVAACLPAVADEVGEPADGSALHGDAGGADGVGADVLVERGTDEVGNHADGVGRRGDQAHIAGVADVRAVGKELLLNLREHVLWGTGGLRQRLVEEPGENGWFDIRKDWLLLDLLEV